MRCWKPTDECSPEDDGMSFPAVRRVALPEVMGPSGANTPRLGQASGVRGSVRQSSETNKGGEAPRINGNPRKAGAKRGVLQGRRDGNPLID